jgi:peptidoglycan hydrolase CwlO-like protein
MTSDLLELENYIAETDPANADLAYEDSLVNQVNSELGTVQAEAESLSSSDSDYNDASERFGNRADQFTTAIRRLQKQLAALPRQ